MKTTGDVAVRSRNVGLVDALDRVLDKGVIVDGDIYLSVAGIELVYLKLKLLLASVATVEKFSSRDNRFYSSCNGYGEDSNDVMTQENHPREALQTAQEPHDNPINTSTKTQQNGLSSLQRLEPPQSGTLNARVLENGEIPPMFNKPSSGKVNIDPKKVEQGLAKLVLTLVELLRNLMEKQALRRMELGTLSNMDIERLGEAFMRLDEKMKDLKNVFGLEDGDLNLDLGPLGDLI